MLHDDQNNQHLNTLLMFN